MERRLELHKKLCEILGSEHVYFMPPSNLKMQYPCIVYNRIGSNVLHADNTPYSIKKQYTITVMTYDPDNDIGDKLQNLLYCGYDRSYTVDNLHHDVYKIYY